jgi:hypothetical protein
LCRATCEPPSRQEIGEDVLSDFVLIDLYSQRKAVSNHVEGWSLSAVLDWMGQYGEIKPLSDTHFIFWSKIDRKRTVFGFDQDGKLMVETSGWYYQ